MIRCYVLTNHSGPSGQVCLTSSNVKVSVNLAILHPLTINCHPVSCIYTIRYDTIRDAILNVRSKADISQLNLPHGTAAGSITIGYDRIRQILTLIFLGNICKRTANFRHKFVSCSRLLVCVGE